MDRFDRAVIEAAELRVRQREQAARSAARLGWPEHAAELRSMADFDRKVADDTRRAANWKDAKSCQRPPF